MIPWTAAPLASFSVAEQTRDGELVAPRVLYSKYTALYCSTVVMIINRAPIHALRGAPFPDRFSVAAPCTPARLHAMPVSRSGLPVPGGNRARTR